MRYLGENYLQYSDKLITSLKENTALLNCSDDIEIVHKIRTSIRKLRGILRLFSLSGEGEKKLKFLADSLNSLRDLEVQLELVSGYPQFQGLRKEKLSQWELEKNSIIKKNLQFDTSEISRFFSRNLKRKTVTSLEVYEKTIKTLSPLVSSLKNISEGESQRNLLHLFRIQLKKSVYLLEALTLKNPALNPSVEDLKKYQDLLGEIHDFHLLGWNEKEDEKIRFLNIQIHGFQKIIEEILQVLKFDILKNFPNSNLKSLLLSEREIDFLTADFHFQMNSGRKISEKFSPDMGHIMRVQKKSLDILETLNPLFNFTQKEKHLLLLSALLHDTGHYLRNKNHSEESRNIIFRSRSMGIDFISKIKIGWIIKSHSGKIEESRDLKIFTRKERKRIKILAGILRTADGMELESVEYMENYTFQLKGRKLLLNCKGVSRKLRKRFLSKSRYLAKEVNLKFQDAQCL